MAPNRLTALQNALANPRQQKGLTYGELLLDNLIGLDNEYLSAGEQFGQAFNADPLGVMKSAGLSAYEGAKKAVTQPLTTAEELLAGLYESGVDVASTLGPEPTYLNDTLMELYGVGYDEATDEQVNRAREALFGDVLNVGAVASGLGAAGTGVKGLASLPFRGERRAQERIAELEAFQREAELSARRDAELDARNNDDIEDPGDDYFEAQNRRLAQETPILELLTRETEGANLNPYERERIEAYRLNEQRQRQQQLPPDFGPTIEEMLPADPVVVPEAPLIDVDDYDPRAGYDSLQRYFDDEFPRLVERAQLGTPLREREAYDVMMYERYGNHGILDPINSFENWRQNAGDIQGARRIAYLMDPTNPQGRAEPVEYDDFYEQDVNNDLNWDVDDDAWNPRLGMSSSYEVRPTIGQAEGIAGLYSPTRKAVDLLDRPSYDDLDSLRVQLLNRGAKPDELERLMAKIPGTKNNPMSAEQVEAFLNDPKAGQFSKEDLARFADEAAQDVVVSTRTLDNSPRDNMVFLDESYFLRGAEDIGANVFEAPVGSAAPDAASAHFTSSAAGRAPVLHTRFGMFRSPGADKPDTYHLGEVQSDWAQTRQKLFPTQEALAEAEGRYAVANDRLMDLASQRRQMKKDWEQRYGALSSMDPRFPNAPNIYEDAGYQALEKAAEEAREEVSSLGNKISLTQQHGTRGEFDAKYPAPYVGTTSKWVQLGLRQSLLDAVNKGAKRMTLSTGEMVKSYTRGKLEGQKKFYDDTVLKELDTVLKKFAKEAGIRKPEITLSQIEGRRGQRYTVPTVEFTDEFVEAIKRIGLPAYAKGGIVKGSYLDNDPLEPALY